MPDLNDPADNNAYLAADLGSYYASRRGIATWVVYGSIYTVAPDGPGWASGYFGCCRKGDPR